MANNTKQQVVNTFTDGLNTDLHPLTTPNTVLTDCINGTVITYNGNEFILQNDMGNYKLKKAQLPPDYIPVGIKEYGSIIYIVSYNPIDKKCQIGSYPSPQTLFDNTEKPSDKNAQYKGIQINELSSNWVWSDNSDTSSQKIDENSNVLFTKYSPQQNITILFPQEGDIKDTFLNPGDKYWLYNEKLDPNYIGKEEETWAFQKIDYYTLTDTKEVYKTEYVEEKGSGTIDNEHMPYVTWETPGWLGYKPSLLNLESFNIYLTDITLPAFLSEKTPNKELDGGELSFKIQGEATVNTDTIWSQHFNNLNVLFEIQIGNSQYITLERVIEREIDNYGNKIDVITFNTKLSKHFITTNDKTATIRATPYLYNKLGIIYDNFRVEYQINLNNLYSLDKISVFDTYKYITSNTDITINFSVVSPTIQNTLNWKYCIYKIDSDKGKFTKTIPIDSFKDVYNNAIYKNFAEINILGQNILNLEFSNDFLKENIYIFSLEISSKSTDSNNIPNFKKVYNKFLITSEVLNSFYSKTNRYQDISLKEWISKCTLYQKLPNAKDIKTINGYNRNLYFSISSINDLFKGMPSDRFKENANDINININSPVSLYTGNLEVIPRIIKYKIADPIIFNNNGIWENVKYITNVVADIEYNTSRGVQYDSSNSVASEKELDIKYDYFTAYPSTYLTYTKDGFIGEKYYLYRNIYQKWSSDFIPIHPDITAAKINAKMKNITTPRLLYFGKGGDNRNPDIRLAQDYSLNSGTTETLNTSQQFFYNKNKNGNDNSGGLTLASNNTVGNRSWWKITNRVSDADSFLGDAASNGETFYPIQFKRIENSSDDNYGFIFPDGMDTRASHTGSTWGYGYGYGIACKSGNLTTIALVKLDNIGGTFYLHNVGDRHCAWLMSDSRDYNYGPRNSLFTKVFLAIGTKLFAYPKLIPGTESFIKSSGQDIVTSNNTAKVIYNSSDTVSNIYYKNVSLLSEDNLNIDTWEVVPEELYNIKYNNDIVFTTIKSNFSYTTPSIPPLDPILDIIFLNNINKKISNALLTFDETSKASIGTVYYDETLNTQVNITLENLTKQLISITSGNTCNFYYNSVPENNWGTIYGSGGTRKDTHMMRSIDLSEMFSNVITMSNDVKEALLTVDDQWLKHNGIK